MFKKRITTFQFMMISALLFAAVSSLVLYLAYTQKKDFHNYFTTAYKNMDTFFRQECFENGMTASTDEIHEFTFGERRRHGEIGYAVFRGSGFMFHTYEIYNTLNTFQLIYVRRHVNSISYLQKPQAKFYFNGSYYDIWEDTQKYDISPKDAYKSCLEYYKKKYTDKGGFETSIDMLHDLRDKYCYYTLFLQKYDITDERYENEKFSIQIGHFKYLYEAGFDWKIILNDIVKYFLLIIAIPFFIFSATHFNKILHIYLIINMLFLISSYHIYDNNILSADTYKTIWPFTDKIIKKENKEVFLGTNEDGVSVSRKTDEVQIVGLRPLAGYDISEFMIYCIIGYLVYAQFIKKQRS